MAVYYGACVQHNAWSGESGGSYVLLRWQRLFDGWPELSLQSAATSLWLFAKFSWTVSLDKSNIARTCVISTQSNLYKAASYWLMAVLHIPHKDTGFFSAYTFVSFCSRLTSQKYQSSLVYEGKNDLVCCDDISPYICAFLSVWCPATKLRVIPELCAIVWFSII